jgi:hypothetical protein
VQVKSEFLPPVTIYGSKPIVTAMVAPT